MNSVLLMFCAVTFLLAVTMNIIDSMHFFQLNSYRFDTHTKWISENAKRYVKHVFFTVLLCIAIVPEMNILFKLIACEAIFLMAIPAEKPKKAKKPLVYTPRVKRMLTTESILIILATVPVSVWATDAKRESFALAAFAATIV